MDRKRNRGVCAVIACMLAALLAAGCGAADSSIAAAESYETEESSGFQESWAAYDEAPGSDSAKTDGGGSTGETAGLKIVHSGSVSIDSTEYDETVKDIQGLIARYGCLIADARETNSDRSWRDTSCDTSERHFDWTIRVPSEHFDAFMSSIGSVHGHINSKSQSASDMTKEYRDNETEIASLRVQESRLLQFMEEAETITEMLEIEDRLNDVRLELEYLQNANNNIDEKVQYSTVTVSVSEVLQYQSTGLSFGQRLSQAFSNSSSGFVRVIQSLIILVVLLLPYLVIAAVVAVILLLTRDRRAARAARKKEARRKRIAEINRGYAASRAEQQAGGDKDQGGEP